MRRFSIFVFLILLIFSRLCSAQSYKVNELIDESRYSEAASILENAIENGHADVTEMINLVYCYIKMHDYQKAEQTYGKIPAETKLDHIQYFYYGEVLRYNGKYNEAKEQFGKYLEKVPGDFYTDVCIRSCDSLLFWNKQPSNVTVKNAKDINTISEELWPIPTKDGLFYISNNKDLLKNTGSYSKFADSRVSFIFQMKDGKTSVFRPFNDSINYTAFVTRNGNSAMVVKQVKNLVDGLYEGNPIMLFSDDNKVWKEFQPAETPAGYIMTHPCFSNNGKRIYFASDIPGGYGRSDIYYSDYSDGHWNKPVNLGSSINTPGNEMFPNITDDNNMLFFASDGHPGYGNLDIFSSAYKGVNWETPKNMRSPVNSIGNDFGFIFSTDAYHGYFVSNRYVSSVGGNDIYTFQFPETIIIPDTGKKPEIKICPADTALVFFETAKWAIDSVFYEQLDSLAIFMKKHPYLTLNVASWADQRGLDSINENICKKRALSVAQWFTAKGIDAKRIITKPSGVSKQNEMAQIIYHVQIGSSYKSGLQDYYSKSIKNEAPVAWNKSGKNYYYYTGNGTMTEMKKLETDLKSKHKITCKITGSYSNYYLVDHIYSPNRRAEIYFTK